jgi:sec-independent protein translocase protein TatC
MLIAFCQPPLYTVCPTTLPTIARKEHVNCNLIFNAVMDSLPINFFFALLLSLPFFFYQFWLFVKPALYPYEKSILAWFLLLNGSLFYSGIGLGYQFILPLCFHFFIHATPTSVLFLPTIESYLNFTICFLLTMGFLFNIPLWMTLLVKFHCIRLQTLQNIRRYYIIFSFILAMLLTPPEVLCQILLAVPLCLFFEIGLILCRFIPLSPNPLPAQKRNGF